MTADQEEANKTKDLLKASILMKATPYSAESSPATSIFEEMEVKEEEDETGVQPDRTPEERYRKKKELNRLAAQRSRERRRQLIKTLEEQVDQLEKYNSSMVNEITSMRREIAQLDYMLQNHQCVMMQ
eukprot:Seg1965.3 transcript_id=Seg1965.3/GoldUCD/mRNA.D3Y31 product="Cyclic AMP-responsive element-binding protein 5" protein_id=Seg1965.3/GoldUCD/D3Y31